MSISSDKTFCVYKNFWPLFLALEFGLLFENFNLVNNYWTVSARALIFHISVLCKIFNMIYLLVWLYQDINPSGLLPVSLELAIIMGIFVFHKDIMLLNALHEEVKSTWWCFSAIRSTYLKLNSLPNWY